MAATERPPYVFVYMLPLLEARVAMEGVQDIN